MYIKYDRISSIPSYKRGYNVWKNHFQNLKNKYQCRHVKTVQFSGNRNSPKNWLWTSKLVSLMKKKAMSLIWPILETERFIKVLALNVLRWQMLNFLEYLKHLFFICMCVCMWVCVHSLPFICICGSGGLSVDKMAAPGFSLIIGV